jgi:trk system potassium uptake protein TrkH
VSSRNGARLSGRLPAAGTEPKVAPRNGSLRNNKRRNGEPPQPRTGEPPAARPESAIRRALYHPVRSVPLAFLGVIVVGAGLLMLPIARAGDGGDVLMPALFTSVSASSSR